MELFDPKHLFPIIAAALLAAGAVRFVRTGGRRGGAARTWLIMAVLFAAVSAWLWWVR